MRMISALRAMIQPSPASAAGHDVRSAGHRDSLPRRLQIQARATDRATCHLSLVTGFLLAGALLLGGCSPSGNLNENAPPPDAAGQASGFTSVEYFPQPNQAQLKSRLTGTEAQPLPDGLVYLKTPKLEMFLTNGRPQAVVEAPECVYDSQRNTVDSASHLRMRSGDGKYRTEGDGFLWRQDKSFLTISNRVHSVIEIGPEMNLGL
jgi:hypothetical protein